MKLLVLVAAVALLVLEGCTTGRYLAQAGCGQIDLLLRARDIGAVARDGHVDARTRALVGMVPDIKRYGEENSLGPETAPILCEAFQAVVKGKARK